MVWRSSVSGAPTTAAWATSSTYVVPKSASVLRIRFLGALLVLALPLIAPTPVEARCHPIPVTWYSPSGIAGCSIYGIGWASWWQGPGVARNDCLYPWTQCAAIRITSVTTGRSLVVTPTMYCDCYTGTRDQRLVDLPVSLLGALGLDAGDGLYRVRVSRATDPGPALLPDTALPN